MKTPVIESDRIILRPLSLSDAKTCYDNWTSDPEVAKFMNWELHESVDDTIEWLTHEESGIMGDNYCWAFILKENNELFGSGSINYREDLGCYELGYNIMKKYWGRGLTTEAGEVILKFAREVLGEKKFFCRHATENIASQKVMLKLGFKYSNDSFFDSLKGLKHFSAKEYYLID